MKKTVIILCIALCFLTSYSQETGTFTDSRDGKEYKTVKIGNQTWFAENLAYKAKKGCWAILNDEKYVATLGYLYNWKAANKSCPTGWHLPSDAEWTQLVNFLGGDNIAGKKMKSEIGWQSSNQLNEKPTNESGFNAIPCGFYYDNKQTFHDVGSVGYFWSNTPEGSKHAWAQTFCNSDNKRFRLKDATSGGFSVRCIKD